MADRLTRVVNLASKVSAFVIQETSPRLIKFREYARVELRPPTQADLKPAVEQATKLICAFKSGAWKNVSVKEGLVNAVVTAEVLCWFFIGEMIGRRSFLGYSRVPYAYIKHH
ncbi:unnamed protein product [Schistosoma intercalatum]|nr:unnamed protein product [Schistosoma intercalatum]CAH8448281.1 unnamed protein product [Schistosoma intercalatum]